MDDGSEEPRMSVLLGPPLTARQRSVEEVEHQTGNLIPLVFEREVSGVEQMQFGAGQIANIGAGSLGWENHVVLTPDNQHRRLMLYESTRATGHTERGCCGSRTAAPA